MDNWKDVKGYEGLYMINERGDVYSIRRKGTKGGLLIPQIEGCGYLQVPFTKNNIRKFKKVHRLIAEYFISNPDNKPYINHIDGNKENNNISNLEWCTSSENNLHSVRIGKRPRQIGSLNGMAKLNKFKVQRIRLMNEVTGGKNQRDIAKIFGVTMGMINKIVNRKNWIYV